MTVERSMRDFSTSVDCAREALEQATPYIVAAFAGLYRVSWRPHWWSRKRVFIGGQPMRFADTEDCELAFRDRGYRRLRIEKVSD